MELLGFHWAYTEDRLSAGVIPLSGINTFFGPNGSGKTYLLEAVGSASHPNYRAYLGRKSMAPDAVDYFHSILVARVEWNIDTSDNAEWFWLRDLMLNHLDESHNEPEDDYLVARLADFSETTTLQEFARMVLEDERFSEILDASGNGSCSERQLLDDFVLAISRFDSGPCWLLPPSGGELSDLTARHDAGELLFAMPWRPEVFARVDAKWPDVTQVSVFESPIHPDIESFVTSRSEWFVADEDSEFRLAPTVREVLDELSDAATRLLPRFIERRRCINMSPTNPSDWSSGTPRVYLTLKANDSTQVEHAQLGAGTRRWVDIAIREAIRQLTSRPATSADCPIVTPPAILTIDEPELHLHPTAVRDVGNWIVDRSREGTAVYLATHSASLLSLPTELADVYSVTSRSGRVQIRNITSAPLEALDKLSEDFGFDRGSWLLATSGIVVVEGEHDELILKHFFAKELARARVRIFCIRGTNNVEALIDSDFLGALGIPMRVLFDEVRTEVLNDPEADPTKEEKALRSLIYQRRDGDDVEGLHFPLPDIIAALPDSIICRAFPTAKHESWADICKAWSARDVHTEKTKGFKPWVAKRVGLRDISGSRFAESLIASLRPDDQPSPHLKAAISSALDDFRWSLSR